MQRETLTNNGVCGGGGFVRRFITLLLCLSTCRLSRANEHTQNQNECTHLKNQKDMSKLSNSGNVCKPPSSGSLWFPGTVRYKSRFGF